MAFDGTQFVCLKKGKNPGANEVINLDEMITGSYQIKLKTYNHPDENINIRVYKK